MVTKKSPNIIKEVEKDKTAIIRYNKNWRYPHQGDNQTSCPMLDFMFKTEYRSGYLIFIPDKINKCNLKDRNKEE